ncbi:hypothetical protein ACFW2Y_26855, partial [Streptomyces sp. NPDC058877]
PPAQSATSPNEPSPSWASPTTRTPRELDQALDGEWAGHEFNEDSVTVKMVIASFEAVQDRAIPHEEFTI